jgi:hypothetical protein
MTKQSSPSANIVALLRDGVLVQRNCSFCGKRHLALTGAPSAAPCRTCATCQEPPEPPRGRTWSKSFVAFLATRTSVPGSC